MTRHIFPLVVEVETPDDYLPDLLEDRLISVLENSTAREAIAEGLQAENISLRVSNLDMSLISAKVKLRGEHGPSGETSDVQVFVRHQGKIWPFEAMKTGPPILESQLEIWGERRL